MNRILAGPSLTATDTQTNATATATAAAPDAHLRHLIRGILITASAAPAAAVDATVKTGTTTLVPLALPASIASFPVAIMFPTPVPCNPGEAAVLSVPALGAAVKCSITLLYTTVAV